jgi:hypothetical protein
LCSFSWNAGHRPTVTRVVGVFVRFSCAASRCRGLTDRISMLKRSGGAGGAYTMQELLDG